MDAFTPEKPNRKSIRLSFWDYSQGYFFITICIDQFSCKLGDYLDDKIQLKKIGLIAHNCWIKTPSHFPSVTLDEFVIMPDHVHGILILDSNEFLTNSSQKMPENRYQHIKAGSIGVIINQFKSAVKRWANKNEFSQFKWQRNYFEHIIRNERELYEIRKYIRYNPEGLDFRESCK